MGLGVVPFLANLLAVVQTNLELYGNFVRNPKIWSSDRETPDGLASIPLAKLQAGFS